MSKSTLFLKWLLLPLLFLTVVFLPMEWIHAKNEATEDIVASVFTMDNGNILIRAENTGEVSASVRFTAEFVDHDDHTLSVMEKTLQYVPDGHESYLMFSKPKDKDGNDLSYDDCRISYVAEEQDFVKQEVDAIESEIAFVNDYTAEITITNTSQKWLELVGFGVLFLGEDEILDFQWTQISKMEAGETKNWRVFFVEEKEVDSYVLVPLYAVYFPAAKTAGVPIADQEQTEEMSSGQRNWYKDIGKYFQKGTEE